MTSYSETPEDEAPSDDEEATRSNVKEQETLKSSKINAEAQKPMKNIEVPENTTNERILYKRLSKDNGHKKSEEQPEAGKNNTKKNEEKIILNTSFTEMLETPYKDFPKTTRKKKAINSKALIVEK
ncbi:hypothetical protein JTB14_003552 [Gonioctena quinquepunctata]|nr:hypothetical protein JTB14_003552 [Gonioctena quinquepunctata]